MAAILIRRDEKVECIEHFRLRSKPGSAVGSTAIGRWKTLAGRKRTKQRTSGRYMRFDVRFFCGGIDFCLAGEYNEKWMKKDRKAGVLRADIYGI